MTRMASADLHAELALVAPEAAKSILQKHATSSGVPSWRISYRVRKPSS